MLWHGRCDFNVDSLHKHIEFINSQLVLDDACHDEGKNNASWYKLTGRNFFIVCNEVYPSQIHILLLRRTCICIRMNPKLGSSSCSLSRVYFYMVVVCDGMVDIPYTSFSTCYYGFLSLIFYIMLTSSIHCPYMLLGYIFMALVSEVCIYFHGMHLWHLVQQPKYS